MSYRQQVCDALPLLRLEKILSRYGGNISRYLASRSDRVTVTAFVWYPVVV